MKQRKLRRLARKACEAAFDIEFSTTYYFDVLQVIRHAKSRIKNIDALEAFEACPEIDELSKKKRHAIIDILSEWEMQILADKKEHHPTAID